MYCKYCGAPQAENAVFCTRCGRQIAVGGIQPQPAYTAAGPARYGAAPQGTVTQGAVPQGVAPQSAIPQQTAKAKTRVLSAEQNAEVLVKCLGSGTFLASAIFMTLYLTLMIVQWILSTGNTAQQLADALNLHNADALQGVLWFFYLSSIVIPVTQCIGVWVISTNARHTLAGKSYLRRGGFTTQYVCVIINLIGQIPAAGYVCVYGFIIMIVGSFAGLTLGSLMNVVQKGSSILTSAVICIGFLVLCCGIGLGAVCILSFLKRRKMLHFARHTAMGMPQAPYVSLFVVVLNSLTMVMLGMTVLLVILGVVLAVSTGSAFPWQSLLVYLPSLLAMICYFTSLACTNRILLRARAQFMQRLSEATDSTTPAPQAPPIYSAPNEWH